MTERKLPGARSMPYWKTGKQSHMLVLDQVVTEIKRAGGSVFHVGQAADEDGREAMMVDFKAGDDRFRIVWPVLPAPHGNESAARRQAATMLFHDVKARAVKARIFGLRVAFLDSLRLEDGRIVAQVADLSLLIAGLERKALPPARTP